MDKTIKLFSQFRVEKAAGEDTEAEPLVIEGYANTTSKDRHGDVVLSSAWSGEGLNNYRKNPIILAFHDHSKPIGSCTDISVDDKGLKITAKISKAAKEVAELIADGVLKTFSVGMRIKEADYDRATDIFVIKDVELLEISVVSVPANQDSVFEVSKAFDSEEEYLEFKKSFSKDASETEEDAIKEADKASEQTSEEKEFNMDKDELLAAIKAAAEQAANSASSKAIEVGQSGTEKLMAEIEKRLSEENATVSTALEGLRAELAEKAAEIEAMQKSKATFDDKAVGDKVSMSDKESAVLFAKAFSQPVEATEVYKRICQKYGAHVPSADWENIVSTNMMDEIRRQLVVAPRFRNIAMPGVVTKFPVNPEAGYGTWVTAAQYGSANSSGAAQTHALKEITISAYKLATKEFITNEEEFDSIIALMPIIRDAMVRRTAKTWDRALLIGDATTADPIKGLTRFEAAIDNTLVEISDNVTTATLRGLRKNLGVWGLNPQDVLYFVNTEAYYELLDDETFQTMDKVGPQATLITGQIGMVGNSPVIVSGELAPKAIGGFGAIAVNVNNFMVGNYRGLNVESDYRVEEQRRVLVASLRTGFQQISTVDGQAVSCQRWIADA